MSVFRHILLILLFAGLAPAAVVTASETGDRKEREEVSKRHNEPEVGDLSREELEIIRMMDLLELMELLEDMDEIIFLEKKS